MSNPLDIRPSVAADVAALGRLYPQAFPDEDLLPLVRDLLRTTPAALSLVATLASRLVAHVIFTACALEGSRSQAALLGPLAVIPARQRQGIGSALVRDGCQRLRTAGVRHLYVLGSPAYYGRFGFRPESRVTPPYGLPPEWHDAWQSKPLGEADTDPSGMILLPAPWLEQRLWMP